MAPAEPGDAEMMTRIDAHPSWTTQVLPGAFVFGFGLATFVAPLTATVMGLAEWIGPKEVNPW